MLRLLTRSDLDATAWDACVAGAHNALIYGHTWYLDAVTNASGWQWEGLVEANVAGGYVAVLPVPLRRRWGRWVVYQPLFCQFLALFSEKPIDAAPFIKAVYDRYRYGSRWQLLLDPMPNLPPQVRWQVMHTHVLPLVEMGSKRDAISWRDGIPHSYTADRRMNLRRATRRVADVPDWQLTESTDVEPLLTLFRENHADQIGVGEWSYNLFRATFRAVQERGLGTLQYAWAGGSIVAGALFVAHHKRIIYLFNAANAEGRRLNARSILMDNQIREGTEKAAMAPHLLDFESPDKPGVVAFYESFGATPQPYVSLSWNRLTWVEKLVQCLKSNV